MVKYFIRRFMEMILTLFLIFTATFFILSAIPGSALTAKIYKLPEATQAKILAEYGYDKPIIERYFMTLKNYVVDHEFGDSLINSGDTVVGVITNRVPTSLRLGLQIMVLGVILGIILGVISAMKRNTWTDYIILVFSMLLKSVPVLVIALLMQKYLAGGDLFNFPIIGWYKSGMSFSEGFKYTVLPTLAGTGWYLAYYCRLTKTTMLDCINQEYTLTARSKGLSEIAVVTKHVLRNAFIPIVTVLPSMISALIEGAFFIETVFSIPGAGKYFVTAVTNRDVPMVMGLSIFSAALYLVALFITDILYTVVDPRIKLVK